jgi:hypothetical protein
VITEPTHIIVEFCKASHPHSLSSVCFNHVNLTIQLIPTFVPEMPTSSETFFVKLKLTVLQSVMTQDTVS